MGNRKKVGNFRNCYKKKKSVGKGNSAGVVSHNSVQTRPSPKVSSSSKKLVDNFDRYTKSNDTLEYDIINVDELISALDDIAVCKFCHHKLELCKTNLVGLATKFKLFCANCGGDRSFINCKEVNCEVGLDNPQSSLGYYDLNLRFVYAMRVIGKGYAAAQSLCGILNIPAPPTKFVKHEIILQKACQELCNESMKKAVEEAVFENENESPRDLCVALDGTWQKRGHTSLNGVMTLTSVDTGKVLDYHAMSKHCLCPDKINGVHLESCNANYSGTSGGMEVQGAITLFRRSLEKYSVRYTDYLGDGDSSAFKSVCNVKPYGDCEIKKQECVGHVQKRMGKRLRDIKNNTKGKLADGKPLSGKNRLTNAAMQKIQTFYGLAIRRNTHSASDMKTAVWATYYHIMSTNEEPRHQLCPKGSESWCKYNQAITNGESYDHTEHFHLPQAIMSILKPTFRALAHPDLLKRCLKGKSQNPNESLNNLIWSRLPKRTFVTLRTLQFGVAEAVLSFNEGYITKLKVIEHLKLEPGRNMVRAMAALDRKRIYFANRAERELEKKIRQKRTLLKRRLEDNYENEEDPDNPAYNPGGH